MTFFRYLGYSYGALQDIIFTMFSIVAKLAIVSNNLAHTAITFLKIGWGYLKFLVQIRILPFKVRAKVKRRNRFSKTCHEYLETRDESLLREIEFMMKEFPGEHDRDYEYILGSEDRKNEIDACEREAEIAREMDKAVRDRELAFLTHKRSKDNWIDLEAFLLEEYPEYSDELAGKK